MAVQLKDPDAVTTYQVDWSGDLAVGETISTSAWVVEGGDATLVVAGSGGTIAVAITTSPAISAGTKGQVYALRNRITTSAARTLDHSITVRVEPR